MASVVRNLTVAGKLSILIIASPAFADPFEYNSTISYPDSEISFGWFKTLDKEQMQAYYSSMTHALMYAENGQKVQWARGNATGYAVPVYTNTNGSGYCRRIQASVWAFNKQQVFSETACYDNALDTWRWVQTR